MKGIAAVSFYSYCGTLPSSIVGQTVKALLSGNTFRSEGIVPFDGELNATYPGQAITVALKDEKARGVQELLRK